MTKTSSVGTSWPIWDYFFGSSNEWSCDLSTDPLELTSWEEYVGSAQRDAYVKALIQAVDSEAPFYTTSETNMRGVASALQHLASSDQAPGPLANASVHLINLHRYNESNYELLASHLDQIASKGTPALVLIEGATNFDFFDHWRANIAPTLRAHQNLHLIASVEDASRVPSGFKQLSLSPIHQHKVGLLLRDKALNYPSITIEESALDLIARSTVSSSTAVDCFNALCAEALLTPERTLSVQLVDSFFSEMQAVFTDRDRALGISSALGERVIGQEYAVEAISRALHTVAAGLNDRSQPVASFLFLGTSGVGKTELAKAMSEYYFGSEEALVRIDMSELSSPHSISKLIGTTAGHIGYEDGGILVNALKKNPQSVILLDEIEKASTAVHNLFLAALDDGVITSGSGERVDCSNAIFIMTSNVGAQAISRKQGNSLEELTSAVTPSLKSTFRPEFIGRISAIVPFKPLDAQSRRNICDLKLKRFAKMLFERKKIEISWDEGVVDWLAQQTTDPALGVRAITHVLDKELLAQFAEGILLGEVIPGGAYHLRIDSGRITVS